MQPSIWSRRQGLALLLCLSSLTAQANELPLQSLDSIRTAAKTFLLESAKAQHEGRVEINMGQLDPRLRLTQCSQPLQSFQPAGARLSGHTSVGIRCPGPAGWSIYVTADIDLFADALVVVRPLARGQRVTLQDIQVQETDISNLGYGYLYDPSQIEGLITRRPVATGAVLTPSLVKAPRLVRRGDRVTLVNSTGPIRVEMLGEAMGDAAKGERVRVRTLDSKQVVEGWVISASVINVTL